ncbi:hypothetical protein AZKH_0426 [Azoarcus sp. KH32C]|nr:hypothetical protein AZKH_0426 [Azoarcus sp. KH32C]
MALPAGATGARRSRRPGQELKAKGINPRNLLEPAVPFTAQEIEWIEQYRKTGGIPAMKTAGASPSNSAPAT